MNLFRLLIVAVLIFGGGVLVPPAHSQESSAQPDNSSANKKNRLADQPTADQQKENPSDRKITQSIRHSLVQDKSLSLYAHNIKIITQNGDVTLEGPVRTQQEKENIESKAVAIAGQGHVTNQIEVARKH